jgi:hypothetical protein
MAANAVMVAFKELKELYEKADNVKLKTHLLSMNEQILEMKEIALEYRDENIRLKEEIKKLTAMSEKKFIMKNKMYYDEDGIGPYCPICWENHKYLSLMTEINVIVRYQCEKCRYGAN